MRLRTLLAATVTSALAAGAIGGPAHADLAPSPAMAGTLTAWGENEANANAATAVPDDLTSPVVDVATNNRATGVVTADGQVRMWGMTGAVEVDEAPAGITDAVSISLSTYHGAVLHADGRVTAWGEKFEFTDVPSDLRAKAIAIQSNGGGFATGYAVRPNGTVTSWGSPESFPMPAGLTDVVDVSASTYHAMALKADGTVVVWGFEDLAGLVTVPDFGGKKVVQITTGAFSSGVVFEDGTIDVWGATDFPGAVPEGEPDFDGQSPAERVTSLDLNTDAGAVTADGGVTTWGSVAAVKDVPDTLDPPAVATAVAMGDKHALAVTTTFREVTKPTIAGAPHVGATLTATPAMFTAAPDAPATGQWYAGGAPIAGKTSTTLELDKTYIGKSISYRSTGTRSGVTVTSTSTEVGPVTLAASTTTLSVAPATGEYGTARTATATVAKTGGTPTGIVTFKLGNTESTATLTGGTATWALPATLPVGTQTMTATYHGDATTDASTSAAVSVIVDKATSKLKASKPKVKGKSKKTAKKVTITVTVKTADGVSPAGKVTVTLKGKTKKKVTAKVNAKGKAKVTIKKVKRGKYKAKLAYAGNANVATAKTTKKFKV